MFPNSYPINIFIAALLVVRTNIPAHAFLAKYRNAQVIDIDIATRVNAELPQAWRIRTSASLALATSLYGYVKT